VLGKRNIQIYLILKSCKALRTESSSLTSCTILHELNLGFTSLYPSHRDDLVKFNVACLVDVFSYGKSLERGDLFVSNPYQNTRSYFNTHSNNAFYICIKLNFNFPR